MRREVAPHVSLILCHAVHKVRDGLCKPPPVVAGQELQTETARVKSVFGKLLLQTLHALGGVAVACAVVALARWTRAEEHALRAVKEGPQNMLGIKPRRAGH